MALSLGAAALGLSALAGRDFYLIGAAHSQAGFASDEDLDHIRREIYRLVKAGQLAEAEVAARERLALARARFGEQGAPTSTSYWDLGEVLARAGRPAEALENYERALAIMEPVAPPQNIAQCLSGIGAALHKLGRFTEAESAHRRALNIRRQILPTQDPLLAFSLNELAVTLMQRKAFVEAEQLLMEAQTINLAIYPEDHAAVVAGMGNLAGVLGALARYDEAEQLYRRVLAARQKVLPANHPDIALAYSNLGVFLEEMKRLDEAEKMYRGALAILDRPESTSTARLARTLSNLASVLLQLSRRDEAEELARRALAIREAALPANHPDIANSLTILAGILEGNNQMPEAESLYRRAMTILEAALPDNHPDIASALGNLGAIVGLLNRDDEAELLLRRSLAIKEAALAPNDLSLAATLDNLGMVLTNLNQTGEAEQILRRALAIRQQTLPADHSDIAHSLTNLGQLLARTSRHAAAEPLFRRALALRENGLPAGHPSIGESHNNLADCLLALGRPDEAEKHGLPALAIAEGSLTAGDLAVVTALVNMGVIASKLDRPRDAEQYYRRALAAAEAGLPQNHPVVANILNDLGLHLTDAGSLDEAAEYLERALKIAKETLPKTHPDLTLSLDNLSAVANMRGRFEQAVGFVHEAAQIRAAPENRGNISPESWWRQAERRTFAADGLERTQRKSDLDLAIAARQAAFLDLQRISAGGAGDAIAAAAARAGSTNAEIALLVRERDRLFGELKTLDQRFLATASSTMLADDDRKHLLAALRERSDEARRGLAAIDSQVADRFPTYSELAAAEPVSVSEAQALLATDEVLILVVHAAPGATKGFLYAIDRQGGIFSWLPDAGAGGELAAHLRCSATDGLDPVCRATDAAGAEPVDATVRGARSLGSDAAAGAFDLALAHELYQHLLAPADEYIRGKKLIIVSSSDLIGLPWHLLLTQAVSAGWQNSAADRAAAYRGAAWLFQSHPSITVLPAVSSLRALRGSHAQISATHRAFLGVGDPLIGRTEVERTAAPMNCAQRDEIMLAAAGDTTVLARAAGIAPAELFAGGHDEEGFALADPEKVRAQPRLADTRCELLAISETVARLDPTGADLLFGAEATETRIKDLDAKGELARYRVLQIASHGLIGGELGQGEPGLVLTPPTTASSLDDGVLAASEIATLTLAADWVILSACNTAAGSEADAEALSGLAKSFFYAGAKSLLVSSWPVYSAAAVDITTAAFRAMAANPAIGRAEALTIAMRQTLAAADSEHEAHPAYWAPFFLVGEGAR